MFEDALATICYTDPGPDIAAAVAAVKIWSYVEAIKTLGLIAWPGYVMDYYNMGMSFIPPESQNVEPDWEAAGFIIVDALPTIQSFYKASDPTLWMQSPPISFKAEELSQLQRIWNKDLTTNLTL